ncbi:hypothetical protein BJX99DRAFT_251349 [Aspergillus californicus]
MSTPPRQAHSRSRSRQSGTKCATRACDQCRLRKRRCSISHPCELCITMGFECTFLNPQKKRGPPAHRVSQIRQQQTQSTETHGTLPELNFSTQETQVHSQLGGQPNYDNTLNGNPPGAAAWNGPLDYWLPDSLTSQACPSFGFQGSNILVKQTLPSIIDDNVNELGPGSFLRENILGVHQGDAAALHTELWPSYISVTSLIPWIDVYFDRLHPTLPVLNRSFLFTKIVQQDHRRNPQFGAMILALCAFSLTQPIDISERPTSSSRASQAKVLVNESIKMRTSSDFGENPSMEAVLTSFFLFGYLFGSNQHNAARLRLREAIDLASTLGLNDPNTYADCSTEEKGQWLRTYLVLSVTERAYALQRQHPITFTGRPLDIIRAADEIRNATQRLVSGIIVHTEKDAAGMMGLSLLIEIFNAIDEDILICWNARCNVSSNGKCQILTEAKALSIYHNVARVSHASRYNNKSDHFNPDPNSDLDQTSHATTQHGLAELDEARMLRDFLSETQCADILLTQKWVQDRLWNLCFSHGLLQINHAEYQELSFRYALDNAQRTLTLCRLLRISAIEAHGVGIIEKLYNIATSALLTSTAQNTGHAEDESESENGFGTLNPPMQLLANHYLKLMQTLRGGNHPYLDQYKTHLMSLGWLEGA